MSFMFENWKRKAGVAVVTVALASLGAVAAVQALQEKQGQAGVPTPANVVLTTGERLSGQFQDIHDGVLYLRISHDEDRRIPVDRIALIDFQRAPAEAQPERAEDHHVLLLRDGSRIEGQFVDVVGAPGSPTEHQTAPDTVQVLFRNLAGEEQRFGIQDVSRIHMGVAAEAEPTTGVDPGQPGEAREVTVQAAAGWVPTGIYVQEGQQVRFSATGQVQLGPDHMAGPAGSKQQEMAGRNAPMPTTLAGALIGRVGNNPPFGIGDQTGPIPMPASGQLFLAANLAQPRGHAGEFRVTVTPVGQ
jgi:hypothetical protein